MRKLIVLFLAFVLLMSFSVSSVFASKGFHQKGVSRDVTLKGHKIRLALTSDVYHYLKNGDWRYRIDNLWSRGYCATHPNENVSFISTNTRITNKVFSKTSTIYRAPAFYNMNTSKWLYDEGWELIDEDIRKFVWGSDYTVIKGGFDVYLGWPNYGYLGRIGLARSF